MKKLLFTIEGRIPRSQYWLAFLIYLGLGAAASVVLYLLSFVFPTTVGEDGSVSVTGPAAIPYVLVSFAYFIACIWSGICVNAKRCHDRGRSGWFQLVQLIPLVGPFWYIIEAGFLRGTVGPNRFGPDPLHAVVPQGPLAVSA